MDYLKNILTIKKNEIKELYKSYGMDNAMLHIEKQKDKRDFISNIKKNKVNIIAEIKKASPSRGVFNDNLNVGEVASLYDRHKSFICGISVITEPVYFKGSKEFIKKVREFSNIPILRKDFIFHENQIYESLELGASCILLISSILGLKKLKSLYEKAKEIGLEALVEVHSRQEFDRALDCGAGLIGINNRNLKNMRVNLNTTFEILAYAKNTTKNIKDKIIVCESGVDDIGFIKKMYLEGISTFLIGSYFMKSISLEKTLNDFETGLRNENLI
ncbi:MAG: indole-3-glycerol phosphate synthase TrpC [Actinobacteria bacterium]|nr:indole-3-glycerol phosphate synthase TrpC [Actinomycetota bacterium]